MRFWGVSALRYIKSEEISPVERMTAYEWDSQPAHSASSGLWSMTGNWKPNLAQVESIFVPFHGLQLFNIAN